MKTGRKPYIFVTLEGPDDGGDFGPNTPGTKTSGLQEALDYAHEHCRDVYIFGGRGGMHDGEGVPYNLYTLDETLRVPWSQDFRLDGGNYLLAYRKTTGHAIHIDSQMNCRYKFGLITSQSPDAVVALRPETPGPDDFVVITASLFDFSAVVSDHPDGTGIVLDSSHGSIINSLIFAEETNTVGTGIYVTDAGGTGQGIRNNRIHVMFGNQYHARNRCTGLRLGDPGSQKITQNQLEMSFHAPRGVHFDPERKRYVPTEGFVPEEAIGVDIFAQNNVLTLSFSGTRAPGQDIVFEPDSRDNTLFVFDLPNGVTNKARTPTNKIVSNRPVGFAVSTPPMPASGDEIVNVSQYTTQVIILTPGAVSEWTMAEAEGGAQTISAGLVAGQTFILEPGDRVSFTYTQAPTWRWKAMRS